MLPEACSTSAVLGAVGGTALIAFALGAAVCRIAYLYVVRERERRLSELRIQLDTCRAVISRRPLDFAVSGARDEDTEP